VAMTLPVIPAKAGIQNQELGPRLRGDDSGVRGEVNA
jgi:hypothetical protein